MATSNRKAPKKKAAEQPLGWLTKAGPRTHEGGAAVLERTPLDELRRSCLATMLFEDTFYEGGASIAARIAKLVKQCDPKDVADLAAEARNQMYLRHLPIFLARELARKPGNGKHVYRALMQCIQRPDEITEFVSMWWGPKHQRGKKRPEPLSAAAKRALRDCFGKFKPNTLAKYRDDDKNVSLRDVYRLVWGSGKDDKARYETYRQLLDKELKVTGTWEAELSAGKDKKVTFERLLREEKLGGLALLRNLRNMTEAGVDMALIRSALRTNEFNRVLPFRFIAAAKHAPKLVEDLSVAMERALMTGAPLLPGRTVVLVDVSGSMDAQLSKSSDMDRLDAATGVAILARGRCEDVDVFTFSDRTVEVAGYRGLALGKAIRDSQLHNGTNLEQAIRDVARVPYDRIIVFTDEQAQDTYFGGVPKPRTGSTAYMVNVASYEKGVADETRGWSKINGFSERIVDYIAAIEGLYQPVASE